MAATGRREIRFQGRRAEEIDGLPVVSPTGEAILYYDLADDTLKVSKDGAAYDTIGSLGGGTSMGSENGGVLIRADDEASALVRLGRGLPLGSPTGTPTAATNGAGGLTGDYKYAYSETTSIGESSLSPASATVTASSNTIRVVVPYHRRGTSSRKLYRAKGPSFSTWNLVHDFGGANGFHQSTWDDNTADGSVGAAHSGTDTSELWEFEANARVKYFRTHPDQGIEPGDIGILTAAENTGYTIDAYGPSLFRTRTGNSFGSQKTGTAGTHFYAEWLDHVDTGAPATNVFNVFPKGETEIVTAALTDGGSYRPALAVTATMPAVTTATRFGVTIGITGAGSSAFEQQGFRVDMAAGYTGTAGTRALVGANASANAGPAMGVYAASTGAAAQGVGIYADSHGGTNNFGGFFGRNQSPAGFAASAALACSNGATTDAIQSWFDAGALVGQWRDGGALNFAQTAPSVNTGDFYRDSQLAFKTRLGGTNMAFPNVIGTTSATATVANTTTETSIVGTLVGTQTLGANFFVAGKSIRIRAWGHLSTTGTPNLTIICKLGATTIMTTGPVAVDNNSANALFEFDGILTCRTTGASGTVFGQGSFRYGVAADWNVWPMVTTAAVTIDTTASQVAGLTATWGTANAANTISGTNFVLEMLN